MMQLTIPMQNAVGAIGEIGHASHIGATSNVEDQLWRAVLIRDVTADGRFYYAVRSTGIYCRPSCASRRPRRENVVFYADADEAERAGYRACRRCHPQDGAADPNLGAIRQACAFITSRETPPSLAEIGAHVGLSPAHLQRRFARVMGVSPGSTPPPNASLA